MSAPVTSVPSATPLTLEEHVAEVKSRGFTIVPNVLSPDEVQQATDALDSIFDDEKVLGRERGWHNDLYKVAYMLPQKRELFRRFPLNPRILTLMRTLMGKNCVISSVNGLTMIPGCENQGLHCDSAPTPHNVLSINALHCLDDFTMENGATRVVPGSMDRFSARPTDPASLESEAVYLEAPAGSVIAYNGGLLHAGSANKTNRQRRAIHVFYTPPWVRPQWDYSKSLSPEVIASMTPEQREIFAVESHVAYYDYKTDQIIRRSQPENGHRPTRAKK